MKNFGFFARNFSSDKRRLFLYHQNENIFLYKAVQTEYETIETKYFSDLKEDGGNAGEWKPT